MSIQQICILCIILLVSIGVFIFIYVKRHPNAFSYAQIMNIPINRKLKKFARDNDYLYLKNVYLQIAEQSFVKIDGILVADKYIYTIAQRHWHGILQGNSMDAKWLLRTPEAIYIDNPLIASRFKIQALAQLLGIENYNIINIIVVGKKVEFQDKIITNNDQEVIIPSIKLTKEIKSIEKSCPLNNITDDEIERVANLIYNENMSCRTINRKLR